MKDEITLLREENKRLNTIIHVLTEKLQETEMALSAYDKNMVGINNVVCADDKNNIGIKNVLGVTFKSNDGINNVVSADDKNKIGTNNATDGIPENKLGINKIDLGMLMGELKAIMNKCSTSALGNTAKTLVQLYTNAKCSQKDLMKITGLSLDGIAKHIKALKNRNLIIKVAFQQYILSDMAMKMLEAARRETN